ncbi:MAG TPA: DEAD/DEAH box helicase, partial [Nannocystaceae bacterium]|nr:DEAD/DEAH box helicase [Nannocystaceae bacterium]
MDVLTHAPRELSPDEAAIPIGAAAKSGAALRVLGADAVLRGRVLAQAIAGGQPIFCVVADETTAQRLACDAAFFLGLRAPAPLDTDGPVVVLPELDTSPLGDLVPDARVVAARFATLARLARDPPQITIASLRAVLRRTMPRAGFVARTIELHRGLELSRDEIVAALVDAGYVRSDVVEDPGTFAVRGGVIDLFTPVLPAPVRIELFGDEIERVRTFDPTTQRTERELERCSIVPVRETIATTAEPLRARVLALADAISAPSSRTRQVIEALEAGQELFGIAAIAPLLHDGFVPPWEFAPATTRVVVDDPPRLAALADAHAEELAAEHARAMADKRLVCAPEDLAVAPDVFAQWSAGAWATIDRVEGPDAGGRQSIRIVTKRDELLQAELQAARARKHGELLAPVLARVAALPEGEPWSVLFASPNVGHAERMVALLRDHGLQVDAPRPVEHAPQLLRAPDDGTTRIAVVAGELSGGYTSPADRTMLVAEADVFGEMARRAKPKRRRAGVAGLGQLAVGDYVVHVTHGVGRYVGLAQLALGGTPADYVQIEYSGSDRLYLPVTRLGEIERYVSAEAKPPRLDKMGGTSFASKTAKVKAEVRQIAEELLQIYAQREAQGGHAHPDGGEPYRELEATFPFEETPDQEEAIAATQRDLSREQPMDRLICGDVGFGKTEVALRAAFRVAIGGKQVAVLAPTTVLVQQHFHTFKERCEPFGINVGVLSRFTDAKDREKTVAGAKSGALDVVVGTHRLLSSDVRFKDLGLVVIDEEQRFGVAQKERFKKLKTEVDVLTMSATPIPRTLHMSLLGIREISLVMTPPGDRLAVRTFVTRPADQVLRDGIVKELARGGQIFYVVPRIMGIEEHATRLRKLVPGARIRVAHGQMPGEMLE